MQQHSLAQIASPLEALEVLRKWAEDPAHTKIHHTVITGKIKQCQVDRQHLEAWGFTFYKGSKRSNLAYYHKTLAYPWGQINLMLHLNGTWSCQVTPNQPKPPDHGIWQQVYQAIKVMTCGYEPYHIVIRRMEVSRNDSELVLQWLKDHNIREIKAYIHDRYEARLEITYSDPAQGPTVYKILSNF